ncbi:hypothetical protein AAC387_Pa02g1312 [Persea americana]
MLPFPTFQTETGSKNGMAPLHYLAVWHSLRVEDRSAVKTLFECNAKCNAIDKEDMTPLSQLSQGPSSKGIVGTS